jgi:hypothetical protein
MLNVDPNARADISEIQSHPWLRDDSGEFPVPDYVPKRPATVAVGEIHQGTLRELVEDFGYTQDAVEAALATQEPSSIRNTYFLLREKAEREYRRKSMIAPQEIVEKQPGGIMGLFRNLAQKVSGKKLHVSKVRNAAADTAEAGAGTAHTVLTTAPSTATAAAAGTARNVEVASFTTGRRMTMADVENAVRQEIVLAAVADENEEEVDSGDLEADD